MLFFVLSNTVVLCLDNLVDDETMEALSYINQFFTITFAFDMIIKVFAMGPKNYMRDYFNVFDGLIVILSIVELFVESGSSTNDGSG